MLDINQFTDDYFDKK